MLKIISKTLNETHEATANHLCSIQFALSADGPNNTPLSLNPFNLVPPRVIRPLHVSTHLVRLLYSILFLLCSILLSILRLLCSILRLLGIILRLFRIRYPIKLHFLHRLRCTLW